LEQSTVPAVPWVNDQTNLTLGVKFPSDVSGNVTGIRFYKGAGNNGAHIGILYSSTGALLAQATFTGETASGWQQVTFSSPIAISANTTYVAAFFTTTGYAYSANFFDSAGVDNPPLHALQSNGVNGTNGRVRGGEQSSISDSLRFELLGGSSILPARGDGRRQQLNGWLNWGLRQ
jgi:hypothetical protein